MLRRLLPDPFLLVLIATMVLASLLPARGAWAAAIVVLAIVTVVVLFFLHGARLERAEVVAGLAHWRLHLAILGTTFVLFPLAGLAVEAALPALLPPMLWTGVLFLCALPSTVQSAIAFVALARGNVPAAVASASASQLLGVVLTPLLMSALAGASGGGGIDLAGLGKVGAEILLPFAIGQALSPWIGARVRSWRRLTKVADRAVIVVAIYAGFSAAVLEGLWHRLPPSGLVALAAVDLALLGYGLGITALIGRVGGFSRADRIALQFCGTKKSLVQGAPMARVLFPGPASGMALLPILVFHQMQLMVCAFLAQRYARAGGEES